MVSTGAITTHRRPSSHEMVDAAKVTLVAGILIVRVKALGLKAGTQATGWTCSTVLLVTLCLNFQLRPTVFWSPDLGYQQVKFCSQLHLLQLLQLPLFIQLGHRALVPAYLLPLFLLGSLQLCRLCCETNTFPPSLILPQSPRVFRVSHFLHIESSTW